MPNASQPWIVVLPCHNKREWIGSCVKAVAETFADEVACEIVIVENGSSDGSQAEIEKIPDSIGHIRISKMYLTKAGLGSAFRAAVERNQDFKGWIVLGSADLPFGTSDLQAYRQSVAESQSVRIIAASKLHKHSVVPRTWQRTLMTRTFEIIRRTLFWSTIRDTQATQCYPASILRDYLHHVQSRHFFFRAELLLKCEKDGIEIQQIPVRLRLPESTSSVRLLADSTRMVSELIGLRWRLAKKNAAPGS
jgi:dolichyl-phosphate beta-glucosyltransferase